MTFAPLAGAGAYAGCAYCTHTGQHSSSLQKVIYPGNRRFLSKDDPLRRDCVNFPLKKKDVSDPPENKTTKYVDEANDAYTSAKGTREKIGKARITGCKGSYSLRKLPLHDRILNTPVDPMHLVKNIAEHCVKFITGIEDSCKVRQEEKSLNRFRSSWVVDTTLSKLPPAPFTLSKEEILLANERAQSIFVHSSFDWHPRAIFGKNAGMKAHEWHEVVTHGILKFCLRGMLGQKQQQTLFKVFDVITSICAEDVSMDTIDTLEYEIHRALALFERDFPVSLQVIVFHLLHHLPMYVKQFGPVYSFWMYPYERFNSWISRRVMNKRYAESTVIVTYILSEWANFQEIANQLTKGATGMSDAENDEENDHLKDASEYLLTDELLEELQSHYCSSIPEYEQFVQQYQSERDNVRSFPNFSDWQPRHSLCLTTTEIEMRSGPSLTATRLKHFTYKDSHGRTIKLSTMESEQDYLYRRCSYVSTSIDNTLTYGRILMIFRHSFLSYTTTFAYVSWFDRHVEDAHTHLRYVLTATQTQSIVPINVLSKPLVVAFDEEELEKLWILN